MTRTTHTFAVLDVPRAVYAAVRALLNAAGYQHAFQLEGEGEVIDMHGIALRARPGDAVTDITVSTLLSRDSKQGRVELAVNGELTQMDLDKAREVVGMLQAAIEAAVSDELVYKFLTERSRLTNEEASAVLLDFRELRQGTREKVHPH